MQITSGIKATKEVIGQRYSEEKVKARSKVRPQGQTRDPVVTNFNIL